MVVIPDHQLISCIGRGSYGEVWLAKNAFGRYRAVKIVYRDRFSDPGPFERELAGIERFEPVSRSHQALVDVLQVGTSPSKDYFYYVMELADDARDGQQINPATFLPNTLSEQIEVRGRLPSHECLDLGLALSSGLAHLHESGLIHRDIKPSNVIFIEGKPRIVDIGLVALIGDAASYVGTEGYIPPEGPGTAQADIYSLGKLLYEAATGRDRQRFPELPTQLGDDSLEREFLELNEIITKACHPDPKQRYRRMRDLHDELRLLAEGHSIRRLRALERRVRLTKRTFTIVALAVVIAALPVYQFFQVKSARAEARQRLIGTEVAHGARDVEQGNYLVALPRFAEALRLERDDPEREAIHRLRIESTLRFAPRLAHLFNLGVDVQNVDFSSDGKKILATGWLEKIHVYDSDDGKSLMAPFGPRHIRSACFSPDGKFVVGAVESGAVSIWDLESNREVRHIKHKDRVLGAQFDRTGERFVTCGSDRVARIWNSRTGDLLLELRGHEDAILDAEFSPDGEFIATASRDRTARVWNASTGLCASVLRGHERWVLHASFHPAGKWLVTSSHDGLAMIWELPSGKRVGRPLTHRDSVANARFSPDGRYILTAGHDGTARLWECLTWTPARRNAILPHSSKVKDAVFSRDGRQILTGCFDGTIRVWDLSEPGLDAEPMEGIVSADGQVNAVLRGQTLSITRLDSPATNRTEIPLERVPSHYGLNESGSVAIAVFSDAAKSVAELWNSGGSPKRIRRLEIPGTNALGALRISNDGRRAAFRDGRIVSLTNLENGNAGRLSHSNDVSFIAFSPSGKILATANAQSAQLWDFPGSAIPIFEVTLERKVRSIAFSPDETRIVVATQDVYYDGCFAQVFDAKSGLALTSPLRHQDGVMSASFSSDGRRVVTAGEDLLVMVWEAENGNRILPPLLHDRQALLAAFCFHDRFIASLDRGGFFRLWDPATGSSLTPHLPGGVSKPASIWSNGSVALIVDERGMARKWTLPKSPVSTDTLLKTVAYLTGASRPGRGEGLARDPSIRVMDVFARATPQEIIRWHEREAAEARDENYESASHFHSTQVHRLQ